MTDEELVEAMRFVLERMKLRASSRRRAGAARRCAAQGRSAGRRVGVILSGGNVDPAALAGFLQGSSVAPRPSA